MEKIDVINYPNHYKQDNLETIDIISSCMNKNEFCGYLRGNILKYITRYDKKGAKIEDLKKAQWYLSRLIENESK